MRQSLALLAAVALTASGPALAAQGSAETTVTAKAGTMLRTASGRTIAVYRVAASGEPQVIVDGRIVTVPAATLSSADGRSATSLSLVDLRRMARR